MLELYLSELRRFGKGAAIYALANLVILVLLGQLGDIAGMPHEAHMMMLLVYALSGLGLALYQFGTYRQPSRWIWLQHRPLHRTRIFAALVLAALTVIALAAALPLFVFLSAQERFTQHLIDQRYYLGAAWLALSTFGAWLIGAFIMLHRSRWAFLVIVLPFLLTMHMATGTTMLALALACNCALLLLVHTVFRPDRQVHGAAAALANALTMQAGFYFLLLVAGSMIYQVGLMFVGAHPNNSVHVARGGYIETSRIGPQRIMLAGLAHSADPRATAWRNALGPRDVVEIRPRVRQFAVPGLITNMGMVSYVEGSTLWTFSHDRMMYHGVQPSTLADQGWSGAGGPGETGLFDAQPMQVRVNPGDLWLVDTHNIYHPRKDGSLHRVLHIEGDEQVGGGIAGMGQRTLMLTNRRLLILDEGPAPRAVQGSVTAIPLPMAFGDLARVEAAQVADGTLVSFVYGYRQTEGVIQAPQVVYLAGRDGQVREVARRELAHDFPPLFEHRDWWLSPVLHALASLPDLSIDNGAVPDAGASRFAPLLRERPPVVWAAALLAMLAAGLGAVWWTRRTAMPPRARAAWCLACLLLGCPALLTLMVLRPRVPVRVRAAARMPGAVAG